MCFRTGSVTVEAENEDAAWDMIDDMDPENFDWGDVSKTEVISEE